MAGGLQRWFAPPRLERVAAAPFSLSRRGVLTLTVVGSGHGWLRCGPQRRLVWGPFRQRFTLPAGRDAGVVLWSLGGRLSRRFTMRAQGALHGPLLSSKARGAQARPLPVRVELARALPSGPTAHWTLAPPRMGRLRGLSPVAQPIPGDDP